MVIDYGLGHIYTLSIVCNLSLRSSWGQSEISFVGTNSLPQRIPYNTAPQTVHFIKKKKEKKKGEPI